MEGQEIQILVAKAQILRVPKKYCYYHDLTMALHRVLVFLVTVFPPALSICLSKNSLTQPRALAKCLLLTAAQSVYTIL